MTRRTTTTSALAAIALVAAGAALQPGCARREGGSPTPAGSVLAAASPAPELRAVRPGSAGATLPASAGAPSTAPAPVSGGDRLEAVRTVKLFCDLFGSHRRGQAQALLERAEILRARGLRRARGLAFVSARVKAHTSAGTLTVAASVSVQPWRGSLPRMGVDTLFFTLGRVGTTTGGWLITAVTKSP